MTRHADHDRRRVEITDAVLRIAARHGLAAVTIGHVAAAASVSKGRVQHYFPSKRELLVESARRLRERVGQRLSTTRTATSVDELLRGLLAAMLPATPEAREDALAGHALFAIALDEPALRHLYVQGAREFEDAVAALIRQATALSGHASQRDARVLLGLVEYLGDAVLLGAMDVTDAQRELDNHVRPFLSRHSGAEPSYQSSPALASHEIGSVRSRSALDP